MHQISKPTFRHLAPRRARPPARLQRSLAVLLSLFVLWLAPSVAHAQAALSTNQTTYAPNEPIVVSFEGGPGNATDWIGIYPAGITPDGDPGSTDWYYVSGSRTPGAGLNQGEITFTTTLSEGNWVVWFLENDGYVALDAVPFSINMGGAAVTTDSVSYAPGEPIVVSFEGGPGNATDWIGIYPAGVIPDGDPGSTDWNYVSGSRTADAALSAGQMTFTTLLDGGDWVVWFLENDGYAPLASSSFAVLDDATSGPEKIRIGPYLQNATASSMVILWETSRGDESRVDFGLTPELGTTVLGTAVVGSGSSRIHTVELTGLSENTTYHYRVTTGVATSDVHHFKTMPTDREADSTFLVYSDMQEQGAAPTDIHGRIVSESMAHHVPLWTGHADMSEALDFVLVPGDLVDSGPRYTDWKSQFFDEAQPLISTVPYFTALGNHEQNHQNYYKFLHNPENGSGDFEERWYAFDHGNIKVITLDSNLASPVQLTWLEDRLGDACDDPDIDFVFAQFHHAHISETWIPGQTQTAADFVERLVDFTATCNKPSVHFYGHNHSYQRGQTRDHAHFYMDVSGAEGDLAYWGVYDQENSEVIQKSIVEWGWSFVDVQAGDDPTLTMRRIGLGGEDQDYAFTFPGSEIDALTYRVHSEEPHPPTALYPAAGAAISEDGVFLQASEFAPGEPGTAHLSSHFQVTTTPGDYSDPIQEQWFRSEDRYFKVNLNEGIDLTRTKDSFDLAPDTTYYWRVRYRDTGFKWSAWSPEESFFAGEPIVECRPEAAVCSSDTDCCSGRCKKNGHCGTKPRGWLRRLIAWLWGEDSRSARAHPRSDSRAHADPGGRAHPHVHPF